MFSKALGLLGCVYITWLFNVLHIFKFRQWSCLMGIIIMAVLAFIFRRFYTKNRKAGVFINSIDIQPVLVEEILFIVLFLLWAYLIGFKGAAYGTEKFMDYGFLTSMLRSDYMPFADMWYSGKTINYYYGGQYITAYLIKLTGVSSGEGYNLMRCFVSSMSFMLPFALVYQLFRDKFKSKCSYLSAAVAGFGVSFCGNFHYVIYGLIIPVYKKLTNTYGDYSYWFANSTRYIGYNPDTADKTIHEFPAYSSILGDLHAHYINIILVVTVTALSVAWAKNVLNDKADLEANDRNILASKTFIRELIAPEILIMGFMTGVFRWTNFWDFPIYFVVCLAVIFAVNIKRFPGHPGRFLADILGKAVVMGVTGIIAALPFTATFDTITTKVLPTHSHTPLYQLAVLWGLPVFISIVFVAVLITEYVKAIKASKDLIASDVLGQLKAGQKSHEEGKAQTFLNFFREMDLSDLLVLVFVVCAIGLVLMPELVYVKDIYGDEYYRANTMFKLTYQAFILFGMSMGYILIRCLNMPAFCKNSAGTHITHPAAGQTLLSHESAVTREVFKDVDVHEGGCIEQNPAFANKEVSDAKKRNKPAVIIRIIGIAGLVLLALTGGYFFTAVKQWFGNVSDTGMRGSLDASTFIYSDFNSDFGAIQYLNQNVKGQPYIVEGCDSSYSDYGRVSVATGLPTVLGWHGHEWLWRGNTDELQERWDDVTRIYEATDEATERELLEKYEISYIYVGNLEREKYQVNDPLLKSMGKVVYEDENTYIVEVATSG